MLVRLWIDIPICVDVCFGSVARGPFDLNWYVSDSSVMFHDVLVGVCIANTRIMLEISIVYTICKYCE